MNQKNYNQLGFSNVHMQKRIDKQQFLQQINQLIDWNKIEKILNKCYTKGQSKTGRKAYPPLLLFKMSLLQTWYGLSDVSLEEAVKDRLSFMNFCGISLEDDVPDDTVLCRFRTALTKKRGYDKLLKIINEQIAAHNIVIKQGVLIDASITATPRKPKGAKQYSVNASGDVSITPSQAKGVDPEASWTKKGNQLQYGYKKHYTADRCTGIVLSVLTSTAKAHETKYLSSCLKATPGLSPGTDVNTDKGYASQANDDYLASQGFKNRIQGKGHRGKPLSKRARFRNQLISRRRYKIERVFGSIKRWFHGGICRYVGQAKAHTQHVIEALAYNLYVLPRIIMSNG